MTTWNKLTAVKIKKLKERGSYHDGGGLYLYVSKGGAKHWVYRFMLNKRRREMGLGSLDDFSIAERNRKGTFENGQFCTETNWKLIISSRKNLKNKKI